MTQFVTYEVINELTAVFPQIIVNSTIAISKSSVYPLKRDNDLTYDLRVFSLTLQICPCMIRVNTCGYSNVRLALPGGSYE